MSSHACSGCTYVNAKDAALLVVLLGRQVVDLDTKIVCPVHGLRLFLQVKVNVSLSVNANSFLDL